MSNGLCEGTWRVVTGEDGTRSLYLFGAGGHCAITIDGEEGTVACLRSIGDDVDAWMWSEDGFGSVLDELERRVSPRATATKKGA